MGFVLGATELAVAEYVITPYHEPQHETYRAFILSRYFFMRSML